MYWLGFKKNIHEAARILQIATNFQSSIKAAIYLIREISEDLDMEAVISVGASSAFSSSNQGEDLHKMQGICLKLFKPLSLNPAKWPNTLLVKYTTRIVWVRLIILWGCCLKGKIFLSTLIGRLIDWLFIVARSSGQLKALPKAAIL